MSLNEDKFEVLQYTLNKTSLLKQLPFVSDLNTYYTPEGLIIEPKECVRDLGIQLKSDFFPAWVNARRAFTQDDLLARVLKDHSGFRNQDRGG